MEDNARKPSEKYDSGWARYKLKFKIFLYNKGVISKLDYENVDGGTTFRRRTESFSKNVRDKFG